MLFTKQFICFNIFFSKFAYEREEVLGKANSSYRFYSIINVFIIYSVQKYIFYYKTMDVELHNNLTIRKRIMFQSSSAISYKLHSSKSAFYQFYGMVNNPEDQKTRKCLVEREISHVIRWEIRRCVLVEVKTGVRLHQTSVNNSLVS